MSRPIIAVDIDEVLAPFHDLVFAHHNEIYGTNFSSRHASGKYYVDQFTGDSYETTKTKLKKFLNTEAFQNVEPIQGAVATIAALKANYDLVVITARQDFFQGFTQIWLERHFPQTFKNTAFTEYVTGQGIKVPKLKLCQDIGATYIIDDNISTAKECAAVGVRAVLFGDYPWNQASELLTGITRCKDWPAVLEYFNEQS